MYTEKEIYKFTRKELFEFLESVNVRMDSNTNKAKLVQVALDNISKQKTEPEPEQDQIIFVPEAEQEQPVSMDCNHPEWTSHVLSYLHENELLEDKYPSCDGLRRMVEKFIGLIEKVETDIIQYPQKDNDDRATAKASVTVRLYDSGRVIQRSDVADCCWRNASKPYSLYPTSTAATMAEGRCYRKMLNIRVMTLEENLGQDEEEAFIHQNLEDVQKPTENQVIVIGKLCKELGIDKNKIFDIETANSKRAIEVLKLLSDYKRGPENKGKEIPEEILLSKKDSND